MKSELLTAIVTSIVGILLPGRECGDSITALKTQFNLKYQIWKLNYLKRRLTIIDHLNLDIADFK